MLHKGNTSGQIPGTESSVGNSALAPLVFSKGQQLPPEQTNKPGEGNHSPRSRSGSRENDSRRQPPKPILRREKGQLEHSDIRVDGATCAIYISVGQAYHEGDEFLRQMQLLASQPFRKFVIILADTLQRYNLMTQRSDLTEAQAITECLANGKQWIDRNTQAILLLSQTANVEVYHWNHFTTDQGATYQKYYYTIVESYDRARDELKRRKAELRQEASDRKLTLEQFNFAHAVNMSTGKHIRDLIGRQFDVSPEGSESASDEEGMKQTARERAIEYCRAYVFEECAALHIQNMLLNPDVIYYPKPLAEAMLFVIEELVKQGCANQLLHILPEENSLQMIRVVLEQDNGNISIEFERQREHTLRPQDADAHYKLKETEEAYGFTETINNPWARVVYSIPQGLEPDSAEYALTLLQAKLAEFSRGMALLRMRNGREGRERFGAFNNKSENVSVMGNGMGQVHPTHQHVPSNDSSNNNFGGRTTLKK